VEHEAVDYSNLSTSISVSRDENDQMDV